MDTRPIVIDVGVQCDFHCSDSSLLVDASVQHDMGAPLFMSTSLGDYNSMSDSEFSVDHHDTGKSSSVESYHLSQESSLMLVDLYQCIQSVWYYLAVHMHAAH